MSKLIIGIDEVGRGSIAGPVTVAALALPQKLKIKSERLKIKLKDSKKLTPKQREEWFRYIKSHPEIRYAVAHVQSSVIDRINVTKAANRAASRALSRLLETKNLKPKTKKMQIFLDGGLFLEPKAQITKFPNKSQSTNNIKYNTKHKQLTFLKTKTVVRGDEKIKSVMLASIVAKVTRDRLMHRLHKKLPAYGFAAHKGYGTCAHMVAVHRYGPSPKHRLTFL